MQRFYSLFLLLQSIEHQLPFRLIEVEAGDFLGAGDCLDSDLGAGGEFCPEDAREKGRRKAGAGEVAHEGAAIKGGRHLPQSIG